MKYSNLTITNENAGINRFNQRMWLCQCDCGAPALLIAAAVRSGQVKSCGCLKNSGASRRTHGQSGNTDRHVGQRKRSKVYSAWLNMRNRCEKQKNPQY